MTRQNEVSVFSKHVSYKKGLLVHFGGEEVGQFFGGGQGMIFIKESEEFFHVKM